MLHSLSTKLLLAALLSVLCAAAAYLAVFGIGTLFVNRYYMSPNSVAARKAEIYREKGTNRSSFYRGEVAKYNWVDYGSSYLQSDLNAAYLWAQLEMADEINSDRLHSW